MEIIRPGEAGYERLRHTYTTTGTPAVVVRPVAAEEVPEALAVARQHGGPLSVRSGGHGISSPSTNDGGAVIDLGALDEVTHLDGSLVRLGPGARWGTVAAALHPWGLAITSGDSGDVGVGGLATTGGVGLLSRLQGLTIDRVRALEIVTADGVLRRIDAQHQPDLFWAARGAGANLGIATAFELEAGTTPDVAHLTVAFDVRDTAGFLERWGVTVEQAPRIVSAFLYLGSGFAQATVVAATAEVAVATAAIEPFLALPGVVGQRAAIAPYATVPLTTGAPHRGLQAARTHTGLVDHLDSKVAVALARLMPLVDMVQVRSVGGAVNDLPADATAYAHRHQNFSVTAMSSATPTEFDRAWKPTHRLMDGMYLSFESGDHAEHLAEAYPGPTLERLRAIKHTWDPDGVFSRNFDVG